LDGYIGWIYWMDILDGYIGWIYWMDILDGYIDHIVIKKIETQIH